MKRAFQMEKPGNVRQDRALSNQSGRRLGDENTKWQR